MRRLVLLLGLVALAVGVWMMVPRVGGDALPVGVPGITEAMQPEPGQALRGTDTAGEETVEATDAGFERSEVEAVEATAQGSRFFRVRVTNKETGDPFPGAIVSWYENFATNTLVPSELEEYRSISSDREKLTSRYGRDLVADDVGMVVVPVKEYVRTTGRHGDFYGELNIRPDPEAQVAEEYRLELERDLTLRVRVVDSRGEPAIGVGVGVLPLWEDGSREQRLYQVGVSEGPRGLVTAPHLQLRLARWKREEPYPLSYRLRPRIPGLTDGSVALDPEDLPEDPIVVQLPPTGRVVVEARDLQGVPLPGQVVRTAYLTLDSPESSQEDYVFRLPPGQRWTGQVAGDGTATFEWVVTEKAYVAASILGQEIREKPFAGPLVEDQEVRVTLSSTTKMFLVTGRVVDEERKAMSDQRLRVTYAVGSGRGSASVQADAEGVFTIQVTVGPSGPSVEAITLTELTLEDRPTGAAANDPALMYVMVGDRALVPGRNQLGDLILSPGSLVASGRVLVNGEIPDRRVNVSVERLEVPESRTPRDTWRSAGLSVRYPEDGRFEIRGIAQAGQHRVRAGSSNYLPMEPVPFAVGAEDVLVELDTGGALQAVVLVDEPMPLNNLRLRLVPVDGQVIPEEGNRVVFAGPLGIVFGDRFHGRPGTPNDGVLRYSWTALPLGNYRLEVLPRGARRPLVEVDNVHVAGGEENEDARLDGIDLRGRLRTITVRVADTNGVPITDRQARPLVLLNDTAPDAELQGFAVVDGQATILTAEPYLDLLVAVRGYRPKELSGINADTEVRLERFPEIRIRIAGGLPEVPDRHSFQVSIGQKDRKQDRRRMVYENGSGSIDRSLRPPSTAQEFGGSPEVALQVGDDGVYVVTILLRSAIARRSHYIEGIVPAEIEVRAALSPQVFQIRIPEEGLKQAIERMKDRQEEE